MIARPMLVLFVLLAGCAGDSGPDPGTPPPPPPPQQPPPPPPPPGGQLPLNASVALGSSTDQYGDARFAFTPATVSIRAGGTVTWNNPTGIAHTVTFASVTGAPASIPSPTAGMHSRTFPAGGQFAYSCTIHPEMIGQVTVQ